ncbi:hypothetical protein PINS_up004482 [Pythium insidiosum]|nr:hypothetical protein PINS_up004482 [Pythium insidiosum]
MKITELLNAQPTVTAVHKVDVRGVPDRVHDLVGPHSAPLTALLDAAAHVDASVPAGSKGRRRRQRPLSDAEKRAKQRMLVKRSYYRKIVRVHRRSSSASASSRV